ncbi:hypothetical protein ColKHC_14318 [Colletotrichum higginsianum]|nr:hypothetical protein ColKHC_14318 [Colletotrichum higginsianum]
MSAAAPAAPNPSFVHSDSPASRSPSCSLRAYLRRLHLLIILCFQFSQILLRLFLLILGFSPVVGLMLEVRRNSSNAVNSTAENRFLRFHGF